MIWLLTIAGLTAALAATLYAPLVIAAGLLDSPDRPRKDHPQPTPTAGGLAIGAGFALALTAVTLLPLEWQRELAPQNIWRLGMVAAFAFLALIMGLIDDYYPMTAPMKGGLMAVLCLGVAIVGVRADMLPLMGSHVLALSLPLAVAGSALWVFAVMNATNFMDGANGLAIGCTAISLVGLTIISALFGAPAAALLAVAGAGAMIGFLVWNWPWGKVFAGDAGALFAGVLGAGASLAAVQEAGLSPFLMPVLFFPTLADTFFTFIWRARRGENLLNGHSDHFYQAAARHGWRRGHVTMLYWFATLVCVLLGLGAVTLQRVIAPTLDGAHFGPLAMVASMASKLLLTSLTIAAAIAAAAVRPLYERKRPALARADQ